MDVEFSTLIGLVFWLVVLGFLITTIVLTPQQHVRMIETFGKYSNIKTAGLSFKLPWPIQIAKQPFSLKIKEIAQEISVKSSDNAFVAVPIRVQYRVDGARADSAFYLLDDAEGQLASYIINQVRSTAAGQTFDDLFKAKDNFEQDVEQTLKERLGGYGFVIENVLVDDPQPSADLRTAFDRVLASERLKEAARNEGEANKIKQVLEAEAQKESLHLKAEGFANFRKIIAEGNAEALNAFRGELDLDPKLVLEFFAQTNTMDALRDAAAAGGRTVIVTNDKLSPLNALLGENDKA